MNKILIIAALVAFSQQVQAKARIADAAFVKAMTPPAEYDHPYKGIVIITRTKDQAETRRLCPTAVFNQPLAIGCARTIPVGCELVISPNGVIALAGLSLEFVTRHELAHCNGWPQDHGRQNPGAIKP
jgi:hypothetical protein